MTLEDKIEDIMWDNIHPDRGYVKGITETVSIIMDIIRDNITLEWKSDLSGRGVIVATKVGRQYAAFDEGDPRWALSQGGAGYRYFHVESLEEAKADALEHHRNTIMSEIGG